MSVLLPAPFSPRSANTSPACRSRSTPRSARTPGKDLTMPRIDSRGWVMGQPYSPRLAGGETHPRQAGGYMLLQLRIFVSVGLAIQAGRNENLRWHLFALEVAGDHLGRLIA